MKLTSARPYSDPEKAARRLMEHAHAFEPGRPHLHRKAQGPSLVDKATPAEYSAGLDEAIKRRWLVLHESGTFVKLTQSGTDLLPALMESSIGTQLLRRASPKWFIATTWTSGRDSATHGSNGLILNSIFAILEKNEKNPADTKHRDEKLP